VPEESDKLKTLRLKLEDLQHENERLRDTRAGITGQLGPLPISAAIVAGLVSGFASSGKAHLNQALVISALGAFCVMVVVSITASVLKPYRKLRDDAEQELDKPRDATTPTQWYERMIAIEHRVRGTSTRPSGVGGHLARLSPVPSLRATKDLQDGCDREWKGLFLTKTLFVVVIVLLILARVVG
jgi:hypothetical protein